VKFLPRQKIYFSVATVVFFSHLVVAANAVPSLHLTLYGDTTPCVLLVLALLALRENFRGAPGILSLFWKVFAGGVALILLAQCYWFYYDLAKYHSKPSPVMGDSLFLLAHVFFLSAFALRPHAASAGRDLRIRSLDFALLSLWWLSLYGYFSLPWYIVRQDFTRYNTACYLLALIQHLLIIFALAILSARKASHWRAFYLALLVTFCFIAAGNLLVSVSVDKGTYYAGSFYDTPFLLTLYLFTFISSFGPVLQPQEDNKPNRELIQSVWTARFAMLAILSLPFIALVGLYEQKIPPELAAFRLRLVFGAMFVLGALVYWKLSLLAEELSHLVSLTRDSIENLKTVQQQVTHSEKLVALGRLAAGAAHEISNPLTAIFGYSELLTDIPSLSPEDRANAQLIQQQVHHAQAAVNSLRDSLRQNPSPSLLLVDKKPAS
jgi:signal transduction histidine kinase